MNLCREILGLKWFITGHQKKIEIRLLAIAQEQIFADRGVVTKGTINLFTGFHSHSSFMVNTLILNAKLI